MAEQSSPEADEAPNRFRPSLRQQLAAGLIWWMFFTGFWLMLVDKLAIPEVIAGGAAGAVAALALLAVRSQGVVLYPRLTWIRHFTAVPWQVLRDCGVVFLALWRVVFLRQRVRGQFRAVRFEPGGPDPVSAARRAAVIVGISLAPNSFVTGLDIERGWLLVHQLVPTPSSPGSQSPEWPV